MGQIVSCFHDMYHVVRWPASFLDVSIMPKLCGLAYCAKNSSRWMIQLVSELVPRAESTTKDYITAKNNVQSVSNLLCTQVIKPQNFPKRLNQSWHKPTRKKTYTNIKHKTFEGLVPSVSPLLRKHIKLGHAGIVDHCVNLSIPDFKNV